MPFEVKPLPQLRAVELRLWQRLSTEELHLLVSAVMRVANATGFRRALADCREYLGGASLREVFSLSAQMAVRPDDERGAEAIVAPDDAYTRADVQCYVETAVSLGTRARLFPTREAAVEWLGSCVEDRAAPAAPGSPS